MTMLIFFENTSGTPITSPLRFRIVDAILFISILKYNTENPVFQKIKKG
jgi:hypothetical protein